MQQVTIPTDAHRTGGEWLTDNPLRDPMQDREPVSYWWVVDGEVDRSLHFGPCPPADLVALTKPCTSCADDFAWAPGWRSTGPFSDTCERCPDCEDGRPLVEARLTQTGNAIGAPMPRGTVPLGVGVVDLFPVTHNNDTPMLNDWDGVEVFDGGHRPVLWLRLGSLQVPTATELPAGLTPEPGQFVVRWTEVLA